MEDEEAMRIPRLCKACRIGDRGRGGQISEAREGASFEFPGAPEIDPFLQRFCRKSSSWGVESPSLRGAPCGATKTNN